MADDAQVLKEPLEAVTGERIRPEQEHEHNKDGEATLDGERSSPEEACAPPTPNRKIKSELSWEKKPGGEPPP